MIEIGKLLERIKEKLDLGDRKRLIFIESVQKATGITLPPHSVLVEKNDIRIRAHPAIKTSLLLKTKEIRGLSAEKGFRVGSIF